MYAGSDNSEGRVVRQCLGMRVRGYEEGGTTAWRPKFIRSLRVLPSPTSGLPLVPRATRPPTVRLTISCSRKEYCRRVSYMRGGGGKGPIQYRNKASKDSKRWAQTPPFPVAASSDTRKGGTIYPALLVPAPVAYRQPKCTSSAIASSLLVNSRLCMPALQRKTHQTRIRSSQILANCLLS